MCETIDKLLELMVPFVEKKEETFKRLEDSKKQLENIDEFLLKVDNNSLNILKIEDSLVEKYLEKNGSNKSEYQANKYILNADFEEAKILPQYEIARNYIEKFYAFLNNERKSINEEYIAFENEYNDQEIIYKYYEIFKGKNIFVDNVDEVIKVFNLLELSIVDKNNILVYVLKQNNKSYDLESDNNVFLNNENEKIEKILAKNKDLNNNIYNELLDVVDDYVDITKKLDNIIDYNLVDKINISNIVLAKKVWLYRKLNFAYYNMNCRKCNEIFNELVDVDNLYNDVKNIKEQEKIIRMIKGED